MDPKLRLWIYGAKGVGSQGDGSVQFLAKGEREADALQAYLLEERGMPSFRLTIGPEKTVKKAIIPLAGFGTRVFPESKCIRKCFLPLMDTDGLLKPALMILLEELLAAGIEEICLVIGEDEQEEFERFFAPLPDAYREKLPIDKQIVEDHITAMRQHITFILQKDRLGFGHAVWLAAPFTEGEPTLLLLGDFVYRSNTEQCCVRQVLNAYMECGKTLVSIAEVPLERVSHYGIVYGVWEENESIMSVDSIIEKPTTDYAMQYLGVENSRGEKKYYATFGQYVLQPEVFQELEKEILNGQHSEGLEFGLTASLDRVREQYGLSAFVPNGRSFDIGLPEAYRDTVRDFSV